MCLDGEGGFDWAGFGALKTHVTLAEALAIEAVKCAAGDARHDYQEWYPKFAERRRKSGAQPGEDASAYEVDPRQAKEELAMVKQAIDETEAMLTGHRLAVVEGRQSPYAAADIDGMHAVLESLRANQVALENAATLHPERGAVPPDAADLIDFHQRLPPTPATGRPHPRGHGQGSGGLGGRRG